MPTPILTKVFEAPPYVVLQAQGYNAKIIQNTNPEWARQQSNALKGLLKRMGDDYVIDHTNSSWTSIAMLKVIAEAFKESRKRGGKPKFVTVSSTCINSMELTGLKSILNPYSTLEDALKN